MNRQTLRDWLEDNILDGTACGDFELSVFDFEVGDTTYQGEIDGIPDDVLDRIFVGIEFQRVGDCQYIILNVEEGV